MDCKHARLLLHFVRPGSTELEALDLESLRRHLTDCADCGATARAEQRFDEAVGRAMRAVPVPMNLRQRVVERLAKEDPRRHRRLIGGLAAAAVFLLAIGVAWQVWPHRLEIEISSHLVSAPSQPSEVETWFEEQGIHMTMPQALNFDLLHSYGIGIHQGKRVARLTYVVRSEGGRPAIAEVLVLPDRDFLLDPQPHRVSTGRLTVEPLGQPGFLFLVIHTAGSLAPFKKHGDIT